MPILFIDPAYRQRTKPQTDLRLCDIAGIYSSVIFRQFVYSVGSFSGSLTVSTPKLCENGSVSPPSSLTAVTFSSGVNDLITATRLSGARIMNAYTSLPFDVKR